MLNIDFTDMRSIINIFFIVLVRIRKTFFVWEILYLGYPPHNMTRFGIFAVSKFFMIFTYICTCDQASCESIAVDPNCDCGW